MIRFLKSILFTSVKIIFVFILLLCIIVGIIIAYTSSGNKISIKENTVLELKFSKPIEEIEKENPFENIGLPYYLSFIGKRGSRGLKNVKEVIEHAKKDKKVKGILLDLNKVSMRSVIAQEIRNSLLSFKESGKFIYAHGSYMSERAYYLASVADKLMLPDRGSIEFNGFSATRIYYTGMLEKLGVKAEVFKVGAYKSASESYTRNEMSNEDKEQVEDFLNDLYKNFLQDISKTRNIPLDVLKNISDSMLVRDVHDALKYHLITDIGYYSKIIEDAKNALGISKDESLNTVSYDEYKSVVSKLTGSSSNKIAVLLSEGIIIDTDKKEEGIIGSHSFIRLLKEIKEDNEIKAVVLRINSPGGSELASDKIWSAIQELKEKKPVIASMSNVAASGGYYIAMACDTIIASENSITGSIGIFSILFDATDLYKKVGISFDGTQTGLFSEFAPGFRPLNPIERQILQSYTDKGYENFVSKAAKCRNMPIEELKKVAEGHVWSGTAAKENGLVDIIGDFENAIDLAAKKASISEEYTLVYYPETKSLVEKIFSSMKTSLYLFLLGEEDNGLAVKYLVTQLKNIQREHKIVQARLPYDIIID